MTTKRQLPHISRFISATLLLGGLGLIVCYNVLGPRPQPEALIAPKLAALHEKQAQVLGAQTSEKMQSWQAVLTEHPDYRDAYIQLASLAYAQGNLIETKDLLQKAQMTDPNNTTLGELIQFISSLR